MFEVSPEYHSDIVVLGKFIVLVLALFLVTKVLERIVEGVEYFFKNRKKSTQA